MTGPKTWTTGRRHTLVPSRLPSAARCLAIPTTIRRWKSTGQLDFGPPSTQGKPSQAINWLLGEREK